MTETTNNAWRVVTNIGEFYVYAVCLTEADLTGAYLTEADLTEADLRGANLRGADLTGENLRGADLTGACLQEARAEAAQWLTFGEKIKEIVRQG